uniref:Uncharacterized protein n=1 Tax=Rhizophora mucronata TaxID=61149 RepID=A0A2P2P3C3_RHIMU
MTQWLKTYNYSGPIFVNLDMPHPQQYFSKKDKCLKVLTYRLTISWHILAISATSSHAIVLHVTIS